MQERLLVGRDQSNLRSRSDVLELQSDGALETHVAPSIYNEELGRLGFGSERKRHLGSEVVLRCWTTIRCNPFLVKPTNEPLVLILGRKVCPVLGRRRHH